MCAGPEVGFHRDGEISSILGWIGEPTEETLDPVVFLKASEDWNLNANGLALSHVRGLNEMNAMRFGLQSGHVSNFATQLAV
jgi:hypothetical protein